MKYPLFECHKTVRAFEIGKIEGHTIYPLDEKLPPMDVDSKFIDKHPLNQPGYIVIYEDDYASFSPKDVFELGYSIS